MCNKTDAEFNHELDFLDGQIDQAIADGDAESAANWDFEYWALVEHIEKEHSVASQGNVPAEGNLTMRAPDPPSALVCTCGLSEYYKTIHLKSCPLSAGR